MKTEGVLELRHERSRELADASDYPVDHHGANLLRLRPRVETQPTFRSLLEWSSR